MRYATHLSRVEVSAHNRITNMKPFLFGLTAMLGAVSPVIGATVTGDEIQTDYRYVWTSSEDGAWGNVDNWRYAENSFAQSLSGPQAYYYPGGNDTAFIGYDFAFEDGHQTYTSNNVPLHVTNAIHVKEMYLGDHVELELANGQWLGNTTIHLGLDTVFSGSNNGFNSNSSVAFAFDDLSGSAAITLGDLWIRGGAAVTFSGSALMTGATYTRTLMTIGNLAQNAGTWGVGEMTVRDASGNLLSYAGNVAGLEELQDGQFGLVVEQGTVSLVAKMVPEPSAALMGLLSLAGLTFRRRRR